MQAFSGASAAYPALGRQVQDKQRASLAGGITDTFADTAPLDLVSQLWEKQHELKIAVAMAQDRHEQLKGEQQAQRRSMEVAYATQQIEFNLLYQLVKKKQALGARGANEMKLWRCTRT